MIPITSKQIKSASDERLEQAIQSNFRVARPSFLLLGYILNAREKHTSDSSVHHTIIAETPYQKFISVKDKVVCSPITLGILFAIVGALTIHGIRMRLALNIRERNNPASSEPMGN